jgi:hypothetical protein
MSDKFTFCVENRTNPLTNQPFGKAYGGNFSIRRPSIGDKLTIQTKKAAQLNAFGYVNTDMIPPSLQMMAHCYHYVTTLAIAPLPEWFNLQNLYDDNDESALLAVWQEVDGFLDTFRSKDNPGNGGNGSPEPSVLVPPTVPPES